MPGHITAGASVLIAFNYADPSKVADADVIGAIAGGGKGAAIGAAAGAGAGGAYQAATRGKQVKVPSETKLDFQLEQPVTVTVMPHSATPAQ